MSRASKFSELTDDEKQEILKLIRCGDKPEDAFQVVGFSRSAYFRWLKRARDAQEPDAAFETEVARASAQFRSKMRKRILGGDGVGIGFGKAKAALEVMSRRFPKDWAPRLRHELEDAEKIFFSALERVCGDPNVLERVRREEDLRVVFVAFCEELARLDGEGEAPSDSVEREASVH